MLKKTLATLATAALLSSGMAVAEDRVSIGTGGTGGLFYVIGAGMADVINRNLDGTTARAEVTGASVENIRRVAAGQMTFGFSSSSTLYEASVGEGPFDGQPLE
ncbi:MAG: TAXI family TRAP transporter solute-binding subunit, partial [Saccharospirillum sp.]